MLKDRYGDAAVPVKSGKSVIREVLGQPLLDHLAARGLDPDALIDQLSRMPRVVRREAIEIIVRNAGGAPMVGPASDQGQPRPTAAMRWRVFRRKGDMAWRRDPIGSRGYRVAPSRDRVGRIIGY